MDRGRAIIDGAAIVAVLVGLYFVADALDLYERLDAYIDANNNLQFDEAVVVALGAVFGLLLFGLRRLQDQGKEIKARQRAEDRAQHLAMADTLTGLPNRRQFEMRLRGALDNDRPWRRQLRADDARPSTDSSRSTTCSATTSATRCSSHSPSASAPWWRQRRRARFGGDEFAALIGPVYGTDEPTRLARRTVAAVSRPFDAGGAEVTLGVSIGIAMLPQDGLTGDELLRRADIALYRAKSSGRGTFRFFEEEMDAQVKRRAQIEGDLRQAIEQQTVRPVLSADHRSRDQTDHRFEALAALGAIRCSASSSRNSSIAIAEDAGLIIQLSAYLLRVACTDAMSWPADIKLAFNISRMQLSDPMLVLRILQVLGATGLSPSRLEVEISEDSLVSEIAAAKEALTSLHAAGIRIALDDFGTGNSSLKHLREMPFDRLKIDRSFVQSMTTSSDSATFVNAILDLSKALGLPVSAEGIESEDVLGPLRDHGCSEGQGFQYSEAVPASEALRLLDQPTAKRAAR